MNKVIDLTHTIKVDMPVYPGTEQPVIETPCKVATHGFYERKLTFYSHTGTHMDAPAHILAHGPTLDKMPIDNFIGPGIKIDLTGKQNKVIDIDDLKAYEPYFKSCDFVLLHTGWDRYWGQERYFNDFPVLSIDAALWMHSFQLKGVGVDAISVDENNSTTMSIHKILLERVVLIENLTHLEQLPDSGFIFSCLPMKLEEADGSPIRAVALL
jgi:arylformamidase